MPVIRVHDIVAIEIDDDFPWAGDWVASLGDLPLGSGATAQRLVLRYVDRIDTVGMRQLDEGLLGRPGALADTTYGIRLTVEGDAIVIEADNPALEWEIWAIALAALRAGSCIVHGAAVEKDGMALLFPSWGGVGKTALVTGLVREHGYTVLGDDLSFLDRAGVVRGLPKPMVLYPYHRSVFPEVFESGEGPTAPTFLNEALTATGRRIKPVLRAIPGALRWARQHNPQSARVNPSRVFGAHAVGVCGQLSAAIWLERVPGLAAPQKLPAPDLRAQVLGSTLNEFDPRCVRATHIAMGLGVLGDTDLYRPWLSILDEGLAGVPHYRIHLPAELDIAAVPDAVAGLL